MPSPNENTKKLFFPTNKQEKAKRKESYNYFLRVFVTPDKLRILFDTTDLLQINGT